MTKKWAKSIYRNGMTMWLASMATKEEAVV